MAQAGNNIEWLKVVMTKWENTSTLNSDNSKLAQGINNEEWTMTGSTRKGESRLSW